MDRREWVFFLPKCINDFGLAFYIFFLYYIGGQKKCVSKKIF